jgi:DNA-directed RNA polymerase subunit M/transcription elongation factor TFIIS
MIKTYDVPKPSLSLCNIDRQAYLDKFCNHDYLITKREMKNGALSFWLQCPKCGHAPSAVSKSKLSYEQIANAKRFDSDGPEKFYRKYHEYGLAYDDAKKQTFEAEWWAWYEKYLLSPIWIEKREQVLERDNGICKACGKEKAKQVHHLTYEHVGSEYLFELIAVCMNCHLSMKTNQE